MGVFTIFDNLLFKKYKARYLFLWYLFWFILNGKVQKLENAYFDQSSSEIWTLKLGFSINRADFCILSRTKSIFFSFRTIYYNFLW